MCKIMMFTWEYDEVSRCSVRKYNLLTSGLTWQEAKEIRSHDHRYMIVVTK